MKNNSDYDMEAHRDLIDSLYSHADQELGFKKPPTLIFQSDPRNYGALSKTAHYDPSSQEITIYVDGRHIKDILRSFAHELVHHHQNEQGRLSGANVTQGEQDFDDIEGEAYHTGNLKLFRKWEDGIKQNSPTIYNERRIYKMSTKKWKNKELSKLMTEKFGFKMDLNKLNENVQEEVLEEAQLDPDKYYLMDGGAVYKGPFDSYDQAEDAMDIGGLQIKSPKPKFSPEEIAAAKARAAKFGLEEAAEQVDEGGCNEQEVEEGKCGAHEGMDEGKGEKCPTCGKTTTKRDGEKCPTCGKNLAGETMDEEEKKKMVKGPDGKMVPDYVVDGEGDDDKKDQMPKGDGDKGSDKEESGEKKKFKPKKGEVPPQFKKKEGLKEHKIWNDKGFKMDLNKLLK